jgi:hypothetical protein
MRAVGARPDSCSQPSVANSSGRVLAARMGLNRGSRMASHPAASMAPVSLQVSKNWLTQARNTHTHTHTHKVRCKFNQAEWYRQACGTRAPLHSHTGCTPPRGITAGNGPPMHRT